jgi:hypothetical protein
LDSYASVSNGELEERKNLNQVGVSIDEVGKAGMG